MSVGEGALRGRAGADESSMAADTAFALSWSDQLLCVSAVTQGLRRPGVTFPQDGGGTEGCLHAALDGAVNEAAPAVGDV